FVQPKDERQVLGHAREERDLGRPRVGEDRRQIEPAQDVEGGVAHGGHGVHLTAKRLDFSHGGRPIPYHAGMATSPERPRPEYRRSSVGASEEIAGLIRRWLEEQQLAPGERI